MRLALASSLFKVTGFHENLSNFWISARNPEDFYAPKVKMLRYAEKITHADDNLR